MRRKKRFLSIVIISLTTLGVTKKTTDRETICSFQPNHAWTISDLEKNPTGLTQEQFQTALTEIQQTYAPVFFNNHQTLTIQANWQDPTVNSYATRDDNDNPVVVAPGGLARFPIMTSDALLAVLCHEIGHFLGGAPKSHRGQSELISWSSAEGEADYFASSKCLKKIFSDETLNQEAVKNLSNEAPFPCSTYQCIRIMEAGRIATAVFAIIKGSSQLPKITTPDPRIALKTIFSHPSPQCRLDTFVSGAKCDISPDVQLDDRDPTIGACNDESSPHNGPRPRCWFAKDAL